MTFWGPKGQFGSNRAPIAIEGGGRIVHSESGLEPKLGAKEPPGAHFRLRIAKCTLYRVLSRFLHHFGRSNQSITCIPGCRLRIAKSRKKLEFFWFWRSFWTPKTSKFAIFDHFGSKKPIRIEKWQKSHFFIDFSTYLAFRLNSNLIAKTIDFHKLKKTKSHYLIELRKLKK